MNKMIIIGLLLLLSACSKKSLYESIDKPKENSVIEQNIVFNTTNQNDVNAAEFFDLGAVPVNGVKKLRLTFKNSLPAPIGISLSDLYTKFAQTTRWTVPMNTSGARSTNCGTSLLVNQSCYVDVQLSYVNTAEDYLQPIEVNVLTGQTNPQFGKILLTGVKAADPVVNVIPAIDVLRISSLAESYIIKPSQSMTKRFYVGNIGTVSINTPTINAPATGIISKNTCSNVASLGSLKSCFFEVTYSHNLTVPLISEQITFTSNSASLNTAGLAVNIDVNSLPVITPVQSASFVSLGQINDLTTNSQAQRIYITNTGNGNADFASFSIPSPFVVAKTSCPSSLSLGARCFMDLKIDPLKTVNMAGVSASISYGSSSLPVVAGTPPSQGLIGAIVCAPDYFLVNGSCVKSVPPLLVLGQYISKFSYGLQLNLYGTCEGSLPITFNEIGNLLNPSIQCQNGSFSVGYQVSEGSNGTKTVNIIETKPDGTTATVSFTYELDRTPINMTFNQPDPIVTSNATALLVSGTCDMNALNSIGIQVSDQNNHQVGFNANCVSSTWSKLIDVSSLDNGNVVVTAFQYNHVYNVTRLSKVVSKFAQTITTGALDFSIRTALVGSGQSMMPAAMATDSSSNMYVIGVTPGTIPGATKVTGNNDGYLIKYDKNQNKQWAVQYGNPGSMSAEVKPNGIAIDSLGNIYIVGYVRELPFSGVTQIGLRDSFILKYNSSGILQWTKQLGASNKNTEGRSIVIDSSDNIYIAGATDGTLPGATKVGTGSAGYYDGFIAKYNSTGTFQFAKQFNGTSLNQYVQVSSMAIDSSANIYVNGKTSGAITGATKVNTSGDDGFIIKYNSSGVKQFNNQYGPIDSNYTSSIGVDPSGNIYVAGSTLGTIGGATRVSVTGNPECYLLKYDSAGTIQYSKQFGDTIVGDINQMTGGTNTNTTCSNVVSDSFGNIYLAGRTNGTFAGNVKKAMSLDMQDVFIFKIDSTGVTKFVKQFGNHDGMTFLNGLSLDNKGYPYLMGSLYGSLEGNTASYEMFHQDQYIIKLK